MMSLLHFLSLSEVFLFEDVDVSPELFHETLDPGLLDGEKSVDVDEVVSDGDLILVVGFVEVFIKHLNEGFFGVELSLIVLGVDIDLVAELLSFSDTHDFTPIGKQFLLVKIDYLVFTFDFRSKDIFLHLG